MNPEDQYPPYGHEGPTEKSQPCRTCDGTVTVSLLDGWIHHTLPVCATYRANAIRCGWDDVSNDPERNEV